jgi:hypothetical protein
MEKDGWMDVWMDLGVIVLLDGFLDLWVLERDFVNRLLFWKQMKEEDREEDNRASKV